MRITLLRSCCGEGYALLQQCIKWCKANNIKYDFAVKSRFNGQTTTRGNPKLFVDDVECNQEFLNKIQIK